jgi:hypothetical protein
MVLGNRSNRVADFRKAVAVTVLGRAKDVKGKERRKLPKIYPTKHPHLKEFVSSPTCALVKIRVEAYYRVWRFQNVFEWKVQYLTRRSGLSLSGVSQSVKRGEELANAKGYKLIEIMKLQK